jgi:hypothetical protein
MPKVLEDLKNKIAKKAKSGTNPWAVATSALQKQGKMKHGSHNLTSKGKKYQSRGQ